MAWLVKILESWLAGKLLSPELRFLRSQEKFLRINTVY